MPSTPPAAPPAPTGIWVANATEATYQLTFGPGTAVTLDFRPLLSIGTSETGTFRTQGNQVYLDGLDRPIVLTYVNGAYQSTSYGSLLTFMRQ
ncbi:MAG TPA: hypothetical protein VGP87_01890 [Gemmatimonadales bacterium]|jgi:hypothetical protein|nr:hypothetical protein [Gemmatimonadales bacterium]